jgi:hypothetical protein
MSRAILIASALAYVWPLVYAILLLTGDAQ